MKRALPLAILLSGAAQAADLDVAQRQWLAGQRQQAVATIEKALSANPNELKLRFALGVMRMELGELDQATKLFTALTQDFPDIAEPYNNLAVIQAARGELTQAQNSLEQALALQPAHAQALENLGDVLLRQAARAFQSAQQAQTAPSASLTQKLKLTQELLSQTQGSQTQGTRPLDKAALQ
ncbi:tetratricopeptide repeat protein [Paucibacter sp. Y2R2-4]|uniref:tetratricopeptide repeat protein n=1 Tax=Paucibacter sp. Y2R2-4 TaxID=2893553 RepID=UPI0021E4F0BB|nr:tetratricopeptide repeat protein [Paucibacter sp. Y2R2-4]MCV2348861.1 tetratricopeptide repeat protein [Paucibacter sp. Y2R2-4]